MTIQLWSIHLLVTHRRAMTGFWVVALCALARTRVGFFRESPTKEQRIHYGFDCGGTPP